MFTWWLNQHVETQFKKFMKVNKVLNMDKDPKLRIVRRRFFLMRPLHRDDDTPP